VFVRLGVDRGGVSILDKDRQKQRSKTTGQKKRKRGAKRVGDKLGVSTRNTAGRSIEGQECTYLG